MLFLFNSSKTFLWKMDYIRSLHYTKTNYRFCCHFALKKLTYSLKCYNFWWSSANTKPAAVGAARHCNIARWDKATYLQVRFQLCATIWKPTWNSRCWWQLRQSLRPSIVAHIISNFQDKAYQQIRWLTLALQQSLIAQAHQFLKHSVEINFLGYLELERQDRKHPILKRFQRQTLNRQKHQFQRAMKKTRLTPQTIWRRQKHAQHLKKKVGLFSLGIFEDQIFYQHHFLCLN